MKPLSGFVLAHERLGLLQNGGESRLRQFLTFTSDAE
jgi:hypothetical protein